MPIQTDIDTVDLIHYETCISIATLVNNSSLYFNDSDALTSIWEITKQLPCMMKVSLITSDMDLTSYTHIYHAAKHAERMTN